MKISLGSVVISSVWQMYHLPSHCIAWSFSD